jgi:hypothetical protein
MRRHYRCSGSGATNVNPRRQTTKFAVVLAVVFALQMLPGDRPLMVSGTESGAVELREAPAPDAPPAW